MFAGLLARVAFSAFGKQITVGLIVKIVGGLIIAGLLWLAYSKVHEHFQHITDLETQVTNLNADNKKLTDQKDELIRINKQNAAVAKTTGEQKDAATGIANNEAAATTNRSTKYKEIHDVIKAVPATTRPVDPIITRTLDSVWGPEPTRNSQ